MSNPGTKHGLDRAIPMSQPFMNMSKHSTKSYSTTNIATVANVGYALENIILHVGVFVEHLSHALSPRIISDEPIMLHIF